jgi:hypothetical protein
MKFIIMAMWALSIKSAKMKELIYLCTARGPVVKLGKSGGSSPVSVREGANINEAEIRKFI